MPPPRKPSHLRAVEGNPSHARPVNHDEPTPPNGYHQPPEHFSEKAKAYYNDMCQELDRYGIITETDSRAAEMLIEAYVEYRELSDDIARNGLNYWVEGTNGQQLLKANPSVAARASAWNRVRAMLTEFGMTPASRSKIVAKKSDDNEDSITDDIMATTRKYK
jgi:P27 family predicted phage terminase small subunit